ncbi:MAG: DUF4142 domain-containing protein [Alcaligenes sp.]
MLIRTTLAALLMGALGLVLPVHAAEKLTDPQIAHIAYTAGDLDVQAARQALDKTRNPDVREFAQTMERDHLAVNQQALALLKELGVTAQDNPTSQALAKEAADHRAALGKLDGAAFDKAYVQNEVAYHKQVNAALESTLIPGAHNPKLKSLLETGLKLFQGHQQHAEHLAGKL